MRGRTLTPRQVVEILAGVVFGSLITLAGVALDYQLANLIHNPGFLYSVEIDIMYLFVPIILNGAAGFFLTRSGHRIVGFTTVILGVVLSLLLSPTVRGPV